MSASQQEITPGEFFHIYNRAIGNEILFHTDADYDHWFQLVKKFLLPVCEIHAYCLLPNHYHLLVRIQDHTDSADFSKKMSDAANAFVKWKNLKYRRKGGLFMTPYKRKLLQSEEYLIWCLWYIHRNPNHHQYAEDCKSWKYSSYQAYIMDKPTLVTKAFFLELFAGKENFIRHHLVQGEEIEIITKVALE